MINAHRKHVAWFMCKNNSAKRTEWKLTINNITQFHLIKGYYSKGFYHLLAGITLSHYSLPTVGAPE
jgi:hypothetical protein